VPSSGQLADGVNANAGPFGSQVPYVAVPRAGSEATPHSWAVARVEVTARGSVPAEPLGAPRERRGARRTRRPTVRRTAGALGLALVMVAAGAIILSRTPRATSSSGPAAAAVTRSQALADRPVILTGTLQRAIDSLQRRLEAVP